jgi:small subunit ribosomal protein S11
MAKANNQKKQTKKNQKTVKKEARYTPKGRIYLTATFNNTIITITDEKGNTICWNSSGKTGFSGTRKSTPYAATQTIENAIGEAREQHGLTEAAVYIKGAGPGRDSLIRVLRTNELGISKLVDLTPIPHDGIRPKKRRRV